MKVAVIHNLPFGGAKRALYDWVRGIAREHAVELFTYTLENNRDAALDATVATHHRVAALAQKSGSGLAWKAAYYFRLRRAAHRMADSIQRTACDVAFVHQCTFLQNPLVLRYLRIPTVFYAQDTPQRTYYEPGLFPQRRRGLFIEWMKATLNRQSVRHADAVLTSSYYTRESLKKIYGIDATVVYYGIDPEFFRPLALPKEDFVLSVGRLHRTKGHEFLIESIGRIPAAQRPALRIACEQSRDEEVAALLARARERAVRLEFSFGVDDVELRRLYNVARLTLCGFVMEPLGFVPLESLACGTPVVGVREAGLRETIREGEVGWLVERDPQEMAGVVQRLLCQQEEYRRLATQGVAYVRERWSIERSVRQIVTQLENVVTRVPLKAFH